MPAEPGDVVALTALDVEFEALSEQLLDTTQLPPTASGTCYGLGSVRGPAGNWRVTVAEIGEGNLGAAAECQRAIARVRPQLILFVGIAGSLRPDEVQAGDVVVATKVATGPGGRDDGRFHARPTTYPCSYRVIQLARVLRRTSEREAWLRRLDPAPTRPPHVHLKPVAAVDEVVASDASRSAPSWRSTPTTPWRSRWRAPGC
jgi:hypothetical protein